MPDHEEMSLAEVTGRSSISDWTHQGSATPGIGSCDRTLSNSDQTLSEAVTGHTGGTVHHHGSVLSMTGRPDARSAASDRFQKGSRAVPT